MKPIGGEIAIKSSNEQSFLTDSGRSSLRFLLRNFAFENKKFLIPNFFCVVIEDVLKEENINYSFYHVNEDFSINNNSIVNQNFDVFYSVNFFGILQSLKNIDLKDKILIEDNVFLFDFENNHNAAQWFAFNSYRKITPLTDGSLIKTNLKIKNTEVINTPAPYAELKMKARKIKYEFISEKKHFESKYLEIFEEGEKRIDSQKEIFSISPESLALLFKSDFNNQEILKERFLILQQLTKTNTKLPKYVSFFPMIVKNKIKFMKTLRSKNIFLPNFWPKTSQNNNLYTNLVVFPLFYTYTDTQFNYMIDTIRTFLKNDR